MRWQWFVILAMVCVALAPADAPAQRFGGRFRLGSGMNGAGDPKQKPAQAPTAPKDPEAWLGM
jgi:hypothetical protein